MSLTAATTPPEHWRISPMVSAASIRSRSSFLCSMSARTRRSTPRIPAVSSRSNSTSGSRSSDTRTDRAGSSAMALNHVRCYRKCVPEVRGRGLPASTSATRYLTPEEETLTHCWTGRDRQVSPVDLQTPEAGRGGTGRTGRLKSLP
ncbi:hypothetical protein EYF80_057750 [Liparis tanakae]|uniref:Uncharacterized protein n=1 Tax=Liparis tanakae TaxID=230148 RepID=A0A4Z2EV10_9TELE|nr:hypothetical protein EYF80_057750 [Liparis tanakae]